MSCVKMTFPRFKVQKIENILLNALKLYIYTDSFSQFLLWRSLMSKKKLCQSLKIHYLYLYNWRNIDKQKAWRQISWEAINDAAKHMQKCAKVEPSHKTPQPENFHKVSRCTCVLNRISCVCFSFFFFFSKFTLSIKRKVLKYFV